MRLKDLALEACSIKSWLVGFDETNFAYGTPAPLKAVLAGNDPESHWQALSKEQQLKLSKLSQIECEIDFIILQSLQLTFSLTKDELAHLGFLLSERQKKHKAATAAFAGPADFAASLLRAFLRELAGKQPCIQTDARQPFRQIMSCPLHLFLEKQLGMPLSRYFPDIFNREQEKIFSGCPQMFAVSGPAAGELICISSRGFHNLTKAPGAKSYFNECRSLITEQIAEKLSCLENWTGKDFSLIARTLSVNSVQKPGCSKNTG